MLPFLLQARYGRFFITVMAGTAYVMVKPIAGWFKNPLTGILGLSVRDPRNRRKLSFHDRKNLLKFLNIDVLLS